jgi:hypothetical protein
MRELNFGMGLLQSPLDREVLTRQIRRYDARDAAVVWQRVRAECGLDHTVAALEAVHAEVSALRDQTTGGTQTVSLAVAAHVAESLTADAVWVSHQLTNARDSSDASHFRNLEKAYRELETFHRQALKEARHNTLLSWLFVSAVLSIISTFVLADVRAVLDWIDGLRPGRPPIATAVIGSIVFAAIGGIWFLLLYGTRRTNQWRKRQRRFQDEPPCVG